MRERSTETFRLCAVAMFRNLGSKRRSDQGQAVRSHDLLRLKMHESLPPKAAICTLIVLDSTTHRKKVRVLRKLPATAAMQLAALSTLPGCQLLTRTAES